jgi:crossover junction endodeoxyribonuclease RusA
MIVLPWPDKVLSPNARSHWSKKARAAKQYRAYCYCVVKKSALAIPASNRLHLQISFCPPDRRQRDADNLLASIKSGIDGIADAIGIDDKNFVFQLILSDEIVKNGEVRITISE